MKPFLLLQIRPSNTASDNEFEAFLKYGKLRNDEVHRVRMENGGLPKIDLSDYSGVIIGGGPALVSDPIYLQSKAQVQYEAQLKPLLEEIIEIDFPFMGVCYGLGILAKHLHCEISTKKYFEEVGVIKLHCTDEAKNDPLTFDLPPEFYALGGHKEACLTSPSESVLLMTSEACPIQMIRIKKNIYATQFHTELDHEGLALRVNIYKNAGYFPPNEANFIIQQAKNFHITLPHLILERFTVKYQLSN